jgi:hypothetical protein
MERISGIELQQRIAAIKNKSKVAGAKYPWQDMAAEYAEKLGVKPDGSWFRLFRVTPVGVLNRAYSYCSDRNATDPKLFFYKMVGVFRKEAKK